MLKFMKNWIQNQGQLKNEESTSGTDTPQVQKMRNRVAMQAGLAVLTVILTGVLIFAMTAAWYTNVIQTSGLIFQVEQWGVDVGAEIANTVTLMSPGDEGIVGFTASNTGSEIVNVGVSVTKNGMDANMQKRLYFYVDAQQASAGETMQRVYLTADTGYDYTLLPEEVLQISETYYNNAPVKWHWVTNVLGYYVRANVGTDGALTVTEYLRPIEYRYDLATFNTDGTLATVDGTTTAQDFLIELSQMDGYPGALDATSVAVNGYYRIQQDVASGSGIYIYLLNKTDIEAEMAYDKTLSDKVGEGETLQYVANFTVYAENYEIAPVQISDTAQLTAALNDGTVPVIQLTQDIALTGAVTLPANSNTIIDLGGKTLTTPAAEQAITVPEGGSLTMTNGNLTGAEGSKFGIVSTGAEVTLNNVNISGYTQGVRIADQNSTGLDSVVRLKGCKISGSECAVSVRGNGLVSEQNTQVIIEGCTITSDGIALAGSGNADGSGQWGTDVQVINSTITGNMAKKSYGIYHPQPVGTLNIVGSTVTGFTGLVIKGGSVTVTDSKIIGTGENGDVPAANNNGASDTGDAVYIDDSHGYEISVEVDTKSTLTSHYALGLRVFAEDSPYVTLVNHCTNIQNETKKTS